MKKAIVMRHRKTDVIDDARTISCQSVASKKTVHQTSKIKEGCIVDFISGMSVKETPEEIEAVQPFSKILVDDYGYPRTHIQTRPQFKVKARPSDKKKEYPVDIAVFTGEEHMRSRAARSNWAPCQASPSRCAWRAVRRSTSTARVRLRPPRSRARVA